MGRKLSHFKLRLLSLDGIVVVVVLLSLCFGRPPFPLTIPVRYEHVQLQEEEETTRGLRGDSGAEAEKWCSLLC